MELTCMVELMEYPVNTNSSSNIDCLKCQYFLQKVCGTIEKLNLYRFKLLKPNSFQSLLFLNNVRFLRRHSHSCKIMNRISSEMGGELLETFRLCFNSSIPRYHNYFCVAIIENYGQTILIG
jgi:hypothetical protein